MFLLRAAFWLSLVLFLIPSEPGNGNGPRAGVFEAVLAARGALADLAGMCTRQPDVCSNGGVALQAFGDKVRTGAAMLSETLGDRLGGSGNAAAQGTLRPEDMRPAWHAPSAAGKA